MELFLPHQNAPTQPKACSRSSFTYPDQLTNGSLRIFLCRWKPLKTIQRGLTTHSTTWRSAWTLRLVIWDSTRSSRRNCLPQKLIRASLQSLIVHWEVYRVSSLTGRWARKCKIYGIWSLRHQVGFTNSSPYQVRTIAHQRLRRIWAYILESKIRNLFNLLVIQQAWERRSKESKKEVRVKSCSTSMRTQKTWACATSCWTAFVRGLVSEYWRWSSLDTASSATIRRTICSCRKMPLQFMTLSIKCSRSIRKISSYLDDRSAAA